MMVWVTFLGPGTPWERAGTSALPCSWTICPRGQAEDTCCPGAYHRLPGCRGGAGRKLIIGLWGRPPPPWTFHVDPYMAIPIGSVYMMLHLLALVLGSSDQALSTADLELEDALRGKGGARE